MNRKIALLRGINVGGKRKLPMVELRKMLEKLGFSEVETYIQSGNVAFNASADADNSKIEGQVEKAIESEFGYDVPVIIRTAEEIEEAIKQNPYYEEGCDIKPLHLTFLNSIPSKEALQKTTSYTFKTDKFEIIGKNVYLYCPENYHKTKLTNSFFEKNLKVKASNRNWRTVLKLNEMAKGQ